MALAGAAVPPLKERKPMVVVAVSRSAKHTFSKPKPDKPEPNRLN